MVHSTRRDVIKVSGALLGGTAVGTTVTAATSTDRFIAQTKGRGLPNSVEVVHEMPGTDLAVVTGDESALRSSKGVKDFAPDIELELNEPETNAEAPTFDASDYEGQPGDFLQWDKADLNVPEAHEVTEGEGTRVAVIDSGVLETHPDLAGPLNLDLSRNFTDDGGDHNPVGDDDHVRFAFGTQLTGTFVRAGDGVVVLHRERRVEAKLDGRATELGDAHQAVARRPALDIESRRPEGLDVLPDRRPGDVEPLGEGRPGDGGVLDGLEDGPAGLVHAPA